MAQIVNADLLIAVARDVYLARIQRGEHGAQAAVIAWEDAHVFLNSAPLHLLEMYGVCEPEPTEQGELFVPEELRAQASDTAADDGSSMYNAGFCVKCRASLPGLINALCGQCFVEADNAEINLRLCRPDEDTK